MVVEIINYGCWILFCFFFFVFFATARRKDEAKIFAFKIFESCVSKTEWLASITNRS